MPTTMPDILSFNKWIDMKFCFIYVVFPTLLQCGLPQPSQSMQTSGAGSLQESPQGQGEKGELSQSSSREATTAETSELGCPRPVTFDLVNMVVSYKRIAIYLEPMKDGVEVVRYVLG